MAAQRKYPDELRERAVKMVLEIRERDGGVCAARCLIRLTRPGMSAARETGTPRMFYAASIR
jgi:transposase-like protein